MAEPAEAGQTYYTSKTSERTEQGFIYINKTSRRGELRRKPVYALSGNVETGSVFQ